MTTLLLYTCFLFSCLSPTYFVAGEERQREKRSPEIFFQVPEQTGLQSSRGNFFKAKLAVRSDLADDETELADALRTNAISYDNKPTFLSLRRLAQPATSLVGFSSQTTTTQRPQSLLSNKKGLQLMDKVADPFFSETQKINSSPFVPQVPAPSFAATPSPTAAATQEVPVTQEVQTPEPFDFQKQEGLLQPENTFQYGGQSEAQQTSNIQPYILPQLDQDKPQQEGRSGQITFVPAGLPQIQTSVQQQPQFSFPQTQQVRLPQQLGGFPQSQPQFFQQQPSSSGFTPNFPNIGTGRQDMGQQDPNQGVQFFGQPGQNQFQGQFPQAMQQDPFQQAQASQQQQQQQQQQPQFQDPFQQQQQQFQNPNQQFQLPSQQQGSQFQPDGSFAPQATQNQFNQALPMNLGNQGTDPFATPQQQSPFGQATSQADIFNQAPLPQSQFNQFLPPDQQTPQGASQAGASFQDPSQVPFNSMMQPQGLPQLDGQNSQNFPQQAPQQFNGQNSQAFFPGQQQDPSIPPDAQPQGFNAASDGFFIPQQKADDVAQPTLPSPVDQIRSDTNQNSAGKSSAESAAEAQQRAFQDPITGAQPRDAYGASSQPGYAGGYAGPQGYAGGPSAAGGGAGGYGAGSGAGGAYGGQGPQSYGRPPGRYSPFTGGVGAGTGFGYPSGGSPYPYGAYGGFGYGYRPYYLGYNYDLAPYGIPQPQDFALYGQNTLHPEKSYYQKGQDYAGATGGSSGGAYGKSDSDNPYSGGKSLADPAKP